MTAPSMKAMAPVPGLSLPTTPSQEEIYSGIRRRLMEIADMKEIYPSLGTTTATTGTTEAPAGEQTKKPMSAAQRKRLSDAAKKRHAEMKARKAAELLEQQKQAAAASRSKKKPQLVKHAGEA